MFLTQEIHKEVDTDRRNVEEYTVDGEFDIRAVQYFDGTWYFEVFGNRTARGESNRHSAYFSNIIACEAPAPIAQWLWVSQKYVSRESFAGGVITCANSGEEIDISSVASREGDSLDAVCGDTSYVKSVGTPLYLAPDEDRPILKYVNPADGQFEVDAQYVDENGVLWYDIFIYNARKIGWIKASAV